MTLRPGTILDERFQVIDEIGQGGMGVVYRARHIKMERDVALKVLKSGLSTDPDKMMRFRREARVISVLEHPNIVQIYAIGMAKEGQPYIAMEFLSGKQLDEIITEDGPMAWRKAIGYMVQMCDALEYAHSKEIIHRDIKPSNIVVLQHDTDEGYTVKVVDFGIAKSLVEAGPALTQTEMVLGSVFYMSPGQFQGRGADPRSDVYALGCTFFEMLCGRPPFKGDTVYDTINRQTNDALPQVNAVNELARIPDDLQKLLEFMTDKDPARRPESMAIVRQLLLDLKDGKPLQIQRASGDAPKETTFAGKFQLKLNKPVLIAALSVAVICLVGVLAFLAMHQEPRQTRPQPIAVEQRPALLTHEPQEKKLVDRIYDDQANDQGAGKLASDYHDLGEFYAMKAHYLPALIVEEAALKVIDNRQDHSMSLPIMQVMVSALINLGREKEALTLLSDSARITERHGNSSFQQKVNSIYCYVRLGEYDSAVKAFESLHADLSTMDADQRRLLLRATVEAYIRQGKYSKALPLAQTYVRVLDPVNQASEFTWARSEELVARQGCKQPVSDVDVRSTIAMVHATSDDSLRCYSQTFLAELLLLRGDLAGAVREIRECRKSLVQALHIAPAHSQMGAAVCTRNNVKAVVKMMPSKQQMSFAQEQAFFDDLVVQLRIRSNDRRRVVMPVSL